MAETDWQANSKWVLKSIEAITIAIKENEKLSNQKIENTRDALHTEIETVKNALQEEIKKRVLIEERILNIKVETSRKTTAITAVGVLLATVAFALLKYVI